MIGLTVVGNPVAAVMTSSPGLRQRSPNLGDVRHERARRFADDPEPIDPDSPVAGWSKAYLHHLVRSNEILGAMLMTEHNIWFYQQLMAGLRAAIGEGRLTSHAAAFLGRYKGGE